MNSQTERHARIDLKGIKFMISAQQMERAVAFYRGAFGLDIKTQSPFWSELTFGNAIVALHGGGDESFSETGLSFTVADIYSACRAVKEGGGSVRSEPEDRGEEGIYLAMVTDTENNGFMLSQEKAQNE